MVEILVEDEVVEEFRVVGETMDKIRDYLCKNLLAWYLVYIGIYWLLCHVWDCVDLYFVFETWFMVGNTSSYFNVD